MKFLLALFLFGCAATHDVVLICNDGEKKGGLEKCLQDRLGFEAKIVKKKQPNEELNIWIVKWKDQ